MSVLLKQRTYRTANKPDGSLGFAVEHGHSQAAFLVGPEGSRVSNETAMSLGLVDGALPTKEQKEKLDKSGGPKNDKSGREGRKPQQGSPLTPPKDKSGKLQGAIRMMVAEAKEGGAKTMEALFTREGKPDTRILTARIQENVTGAERDEAWEAFQESEEGKRLADIPPKDEEAKQSGEKMAEAANEEE